MKTAKAILITAVYLVLLIIAAPGLSFLKSGTLRTEKAQVEFREDHGAVAEMLATAAADLNRARRPIAKALGGFQPVFRVRQVWHLYRDGPSTIRRLEVRVDDRTIYRTGDPELNWAEAVLRNRRIRPMAETLVKKPRAKNRVGLGRYILTRARAEFPDAKTIEIRSIWAKRRRSPKLHHRMVARAPEWTLEDEK